MIRVVQLTHPEHGRRVAVVEESRLRLVQGATSVYELAQDAIESSKKLEAQIASSLGTESLDYDPIYRGEGQWSLLPAFDHPTESARCFVTGTGLTHKASAQNRQSMHATTQTPDSEQGSRGTPRETQEPDPPLTDSMRMYKLGLDGGRPKAGHIGASPEWFYKGTGSILRAHNNTLDVPNHGFDGGEESEIAGCYIVGADGTPHRVGFAQGNEFSDHILEAQNYLYLAQSKLRAASLGPELLIGADLSPEIPGHASIERAGKTIWAGPQTTGEPAMCHTLANLEHHHFKHDTHRHPGDVHIHFFGADLFSFKDRLQLEEGDIMEVAFVGFGRPLRNPIRIDRSEQQLVKVSAL